MHSSRSACVILVCLAGLVLYGSLYPFDFRASVATPERWAAFLRWPASNSLGDTVGNIALFLPLGFLSALVIARRATVRRRTTALVFATAAVATTVFAVALQVAQAWLPSRSPATADVVWNMTGYGLGLALHALHAIPGNTAQRLQRELEPMEWSALGLVALWVLGEVLPFVPALDWFGFKQNIKSVLNPAFQPTSAAVTASRVCMVAALLSFHDRNTLMQRALPVVVITLTLEILSVDRHLTMATPIGYLAGLLLWRSVLNLQSAFVIAALVGLAGYTLGSLAPFRFRMEPAETQWVPFGAMLRGSMSLNAEAFLETCYTLGAVILLAARAGARIRGLALALTLWVVGLEIAQRWIEGRTPDLTPALFPLAASAGIRSCVARSNDAMKNLRRRNLQHAEEKTGKERKG